MRRPASASKRKPQDAVVAQLAQQLQHLHECRIDPIDAARIRRPVAQAIDRLHAEAERERRRPAGRKHREQLARRDRRQHQPREVVAPDRRIGRVGRSLKVPPTPKAMSSEKFQVFLKKSDRRSTLPSSV